ncbi:unnamed protein product [Mycetohabitans rhizoxinica HKI 454]|uniref:Uncharacterized protein n=1 Tax=Mycetohabitans rhizoxinica (strain DSM 19002 / CIP 109453 / HKI 454) TaxID=882378 RepID=E5AQ77_MYCRK|nr:unnamed protein product [Mycetohabitans rhizoxinica HKI 454]
MSSPAQRWEVVQQFLKQYDYSERRACALVGLNILAQDELCRGNPLFLSKTSIERIEPIRWIKC